MALNPNVIARNIGKLCFANGKEKFPKQSAKYLHQLGLYYKDQSPDKLSLIRSAALMNAAILRKPENVEAMRKDLQELCFLILKEANAKHRKVCLIKEAETVKKDIEKMRMFAEEELEKLEKIPDDVDEQRLKELQNKKFINVKDIQEKVSAKYTSIMNNISKRCIAIMGEPPSQCKFAHVGMGSLARREITPFSDFENIIVLENCAKDNPIYENILEFFRWYAVIFQIILINLGETLIPIVVIPFLNDFSTRGGDWFYDSITPSGICFDGMMPYASKSPLGRQEFTNEKKWKTELIKPVSEMAKYLDTDEDLKNGYHLADLLFKTCFVSGDNDVYQEFAKEVEKKKDQNKEKRLENLKKQVDDDVVKYNVYCADLYNRGKGNMKRVVYRSSTLMLSALGSIFNIESNSCFDMIEKLVERFVINEEDKNKLNFIIALACEIRLKTYIRQKRQNDEIRHADEQNAELFDAVDKKTLISYFVITKIFQDELLKIINEPDHTDISLTIDRAKEFFFSIEICTRLKFYDFALKTFNMNLSELENALKYADRADCFYNIGVCMMGTKKYEEAISYYEQALSIRKRISNNESEDADVADCFYKIGVCMHMLNKYEKAISYFEQALSIRKRISNNESEDEDMAYCFYNIGVCMRRKNKYEEAIFYFEQALSILKRISNNESDDIVVADCFFNIGVCMMKLNKNEEAIPFLEKAVNIRRLISSNETEDKYVAASLFEIGNLLREQNKYEEAILYFEHALSMWERISNNDTEYVHKARDYCSTGIRLMKVKEYEEAIYYFNRSLITWKRISEKIISEDNDITRCDHYIDVCKKNLEK